MAADGMTMMTVRGTEIRVGEGQTRHTFARVTESRAGAEPGKARAHKDQCEFMINDAGGAVMSVVHTQAGSPSGEFVYTVHDVGGTLIGTVRLIKASISRPLRTRWVVEPAGHQAMIGRKGRVFWWTVWWLLSPVQLVLLIAMFFSSSGGDLARMPRRTIWRVNGQTVLDYNGFRERFLLRTDYWDPRLVVSVIALFSARRSWLDV